ncbi:MAG: DUF1517 domain-containing protein [Jaaginema sp. PMC 1079.18]|nr:DUF1517 domain-containing protein [Jaaginema sp. PMC 1080.18]MEC4849871.1 DUF1517 domain-containing protein [Jaaginema sp. PMC 1079.18]MEC4866860.1 DUF1517 domain-containing protein [Jaaginema sp. PMC 1078.18]
MLPKIKYHLLLATALSFAAINTVEVKQFTPQHSQKFTLDNAAHARKSGGRSGGGSFQKPSSPPSSSGSRNTSPSRNNSGGSSTIIVPSNHDSSVNSYSTVEGFGLVILLLFLGIFSLIAFAMLFSLFSSRGKGSGTVTAAQRERDNDIVTISKLQVALIAPAGDIQTELSEISRNADTDSNEGLAQLLQESALTLLRHEEYWTHAASSSEVCNIAEAETQFNKLQFQERSKFSQETLVNVGGNLQTRAIAEPDADNFGLYIVVTLLLGSADDRPLFNTVRSYDEVKTALETTASLRSDYLMTFYLLWTPQQKPAALTYDEMLTEYTDMVQL